MTKPFPTENELEQMFWVLIVAIVVIITTVASAICYYL
jgi:hypothetical protein